jgi:hypothetical protein
MLVSTLLKQLSFGSEGEANPDPALANLAKAAGTSAGVRTSNPSISTRRPRRLGAMRSRIYFAASIEPSPHCARPIKIRTISGAASSMAFSSSVIRRERAPFGRPLLPAAKRPLSSRPSDRAGFAETSTRGTMLSPCARTNSASHRSDRNDLAVDRVAVEFQDPALDTRAAVEG